MSIVVIANKKIIKYLQLSFKLSSVVQEIVKQEIILTKAQELGIKPTEQELQQASERLRLERKLHKTQETLSWLVENYISLEDFDELIRFEVTAQKLAEYLFSDEVEPFFKQHQQDFTEAVMYEVFLNDPDLALDLYNSINNHQLSFHEVAYEYISDHELRRKNGYKGNVSYQDLKPEVSSAIFAAQPPQVLKPIITTTGVLLIYVEEILQPVLNDSLKTKILNRLFNNWLQQEMTTREIIIPELNHD